MHIINNWLCKRSRGNWNLWLSLSSPWFSVHINCNITREDKYEVKKAKLGLAKAEPGLTKAEPGRTKADSHAHNKQHVKK